MAVLNINDLKPGMVLAAPVYNKQGGILLGKGAVLTEKHLKIFRIWGVTEAEIEGVEKEDVESDIFSQLNDKELEAINKALRKRFIDTESNPVNKEIFRISRKIFAVSYINQKRAQENG